MIPKIIHYCWFGGKEKPELVKKCMESWSNFCKGYELKEWNEKTFDLNSAPLYVKEAYENKKWAFVTDYVRLWALFNFGGVYMDTDVEVVNSLDRFLDCKGFTGFESVEYMVTGIIAAEKGLPLMYELMLDYNNRRFVQENGEFDLTTNTKSITVKFKEMGFLPNGEKQIIDGFLLYPVEYFCPLEELTGRLRKTKNTVTIHWFNKSWIESKKVLRSKITKLCRRIFGVNCFKWIKRKK